MAKKHITSLSSLMIFTGDNANRNALALEDREYDGYNDEYLGSLNMTRSYDSSFSNYPDEIFVETPPKYSSIDDLTYLSYAYITNKLSKKNIVPDAELYIDEQHRINFLYNFESNLESKIENSKYVPQSDIELYLASINNSLYNKQKYYQKEKELQSLSNAGTKYNWMPAGTYLENTYENVLENVGNDFINYSTYNVEVEDTYWDETTGTYVVRTELKADPTTGEIIETPIYKTVQGFEYIDSFYDVVKDRLDEYTDLFEKDFEENPDMMAYYIYKLDSRMPFVMNTYSFGQRIVNANINYDGEFNNWFHNVISFNIDKGSKGDKLVTLTPGEKYWFNVVKEENQRFIGKDVNIDSKYDFVLSDDVEEELDNISILSPYKIKSLDLSNSADKLVGAIDLLSQYNKYINSTDTVSTNWNKEKGNMLEELIIGKPNVKCRITDIIGLSEFKNLKKIDLTGCDNLENDPDISDLPNIKDVNLSGTNISVFKPTPDSKLRSVILPENVVKSIILNKVNFTGNFEYIPDETLTTLELNYVEGIDTYEFIHDWLQVLKNTSASDGGPSMLDSGLVNYVNINGIDWEYVEVQDLLDLKVIELNEFTGIVKVHGIGLNPEIYRKDYLKLIDAYGRENVNNENSPLNIIIKLTENAFDIDGKVVEEYYETRTELDSTGNWVEVVYPRQRVAAEFVLNVIDNDPGNSFIDIVENGKETVTTTDEDGNETTEEVVTNSISFTPSEYRNNNKVVIGYSQPFNNQIKLPNVTETIDQLEEGDVLAIYDINKDSVNLVIVNKDIENINQKFIKIGKINNYERVQNGINSIPSTSNWYFTFTHKEQEIEKSPIENPRHNITLQYISDENEIELFNKELVLNDENSIELRYKSSGEINLLNRELPDNYIENIYESEDETISLFNFNKKKELIGKDTIDLQLQGKKIDIINPEVLPDPEIIPEEPSDEEENNEETEGEDNEKE